METEITTAHIVERHPEDIAWLQANRDLDLDSLSGLTFATLCERANEYVYISSENDVLEFGQGEPMAAFGDDTYAAMVRARYNPR